MQTIEEKDNFVISIYFWLALSYEEIPYDDAGQPLVGTLADYLLPGAVEMPAIKIGHLHTPTPHTEYGMKGMGEGGAVAPPAAIANAVRDSPRRNRGRGQ